MKWYLAGPICHVTDGSDRRWREEVKQELDCIDPFDEESLLPSSPLWGSGGRPKDILNRLRRNEAVDVVRGVMREILHCDAKCVGHADGVLAYSPRPSWGTIREVVLAQQQDKPIVVWTESTGWELSNTLIGLSTVVVHTQEDAIQACRNIEMGTGL